MSDNHSKAASAATPDRKEKAARTKPKAKSVEVCEHRYVRLYSLHDEANKFYGFPFVAFDDAHAREAFTEFAKVESVTDASCYFVGYFDIDDGSLISAKNPYKV